MLLGGYKTTVKLFQVNSACADHCLVLLPYRCCLQQHGGRSVFKSDTTLRSHLIRPKDPVDPRKQEGVVYKISCDELYVGVTGRCMHERIKEHDRLGYTAFTNTNFGRF